MCFADTFPLPKNKKPNKKRGFSNELYYWTGIIDPSLAGLSGTKVDILCLCEFLIRMSSIYHPLLSCQKKNGILCVYFTV